MQKLQKLTARRLLRARFNPTDLIWRKVRLMADMPQNEIDDYYRGLMGYICSCVGTSIEDAMDSNRLRVNTEARYIFCYVSRQYLGLSANELADMLNLSYSTMSYGTKKVAERMEYEKGYAALVDDVIEYLKQNYKEAYEHNNKGNLVSWTRNSKRNYRDFVRSSA